MLDTKKDEKFTFVVLHVALKCVTQAILYDNSINAGRAKHVHSISHPKLFCKFSPVNFLLHNTYKF